MVGKKAEVPSPCAASCAVEGLARSTGVAAATNFGFGRRCWQNGLCALGSPFLAASMILRAMLGPAAVAKAATVRVSLYREPLRAPEGYPDWPGANCAT